MALRGPGSGIASAVILGSDWSRECNPCLLLADARYNSVILAPDWTRECKPGLLLAAECDSLREDDSADAA